MNESSEGKNDKNLPKKNNPLIGFAGLTHLGLNSAVASAARGFEVVGYHDNTKIVENLNNGVLHVLEPDLPEFLLKHRKNLHFASDPHCLSECDAVYIAFDVPTDDNGLSDLTPIHNIIRTVIGIMRKDAILVILCQVPPGFTRQIEWPADQLYYQVETLVFGRAVERAMYPERFIIGCADSGKTINEKLEIYLKAFDCPLLPMKYESAELAKISINMCLVASVSTANTLAEICEHIGADWFEIVPALKLDKRIGKFSYLTPGLGISGGNLERDLATILRYSEKYQTDGGVVSAWVHNSGYRKDWAWHVFTKLGLNNRAGDHIAVLGLTYKENTHSIKNSPSLLFLSHLKNRKVTAFDPAAAADAAGSVVIRVENVMEAIKNADILAVMTPWPEFRSITPEMIAENMKGKIVLDPYRILDGEKLKEKGFIYASLGKQIKE